MKINFDVEAGKVSVGSDIVNEDGEAILEFDMEPATGEITEIVREDDGSMEQQINVTVDPEELDGYEEMFETLAEEFGVEPTAEVVPETIEVPVVEELTEEVTEVEVPTAEEVVAESEAVVEEVEVPEGPTTMVEEAAEWVEEQAEAFTEELTQEVEDVTEMA